MAEEQKVEVKSEKVEVSDPNAPKNNGNPVGNTPVQPTVQKGKKRAHPRKVKKAPSPEVKPEQVTPEKILTKREINRAEKQKKELAGLKKVCSVLSQEIPFSREYPVWWDEFAVEYIKNGQNGAAAYRKAKRGVTKKTSESESWKLLRFPEFTRVLQYHRDEMRAAVDLSRDEWMHGLSQIARFDLRKFIEERPAGGMRLVKKWKDRTDGHALDKINVKSTILKTFDSGDYLVEEEVEITAKGKMKAYEMIGKSCGWIEEKVDLTSGGKALAVVGLPELNDE